MTTQASFLARPRSRGQAFTLIETVMALAIMGLAITALLGLLPHGIQMSKKAADASAQSRIVDIISARLTNMTAADVVAQHMSKLYFDDQGVQLGQEDMNTSTSYVVRVLAYSGTSGITLPGGNAGESLLTRAVIQIVATPNTNFNFDTPQTELISAVPLVFGPVNP